MHSFLLTLSNSIDACNNHAVGLIGAFISAKFVQLVMAVIWTPQIYSLSGFLLCIGYFDSEIDILDMIWTSSMGHRNPTNMISQTR